MNITSNDTEILASVLENLDKLIVGKTFKISVTEMPPYFSIEKDSQNNIVNTSGYLADLWNILERELQFRSVYLDAGPSLLGSNENGSWTGMIGDLQKKRADIGLNTFGITKERKRVVDFSAAIAFDSSKFLMYSNSNSELIDWKTFLTTLSWEIWCCTAIIWLLTAFILTLVTRSDSNTSHFDYLFYLLGAIASQGCEISPQKFQGRIIFVTFWFMCVILNTSFTALLTTNLTTARYRPLLTLEEILDRGFRVSVAKGTQQHQKILEAEEPTSKRIADMLSQDPSLVVISDDEGIASTLDGKTLYVGDSTLLIYQTSHNCSFKLLKPILSDGYLHLAYRKRFKFQETLDQKILRLMSSGIIKKLAIKWLYPSANCERSREEVPSLGLRKTLFAFILITSGVVLSFVLLLVELAASSIKKWKGEKSVVKQENKFKKYKDFVEEYIRKNKSN